MKFIEKTAVELVADLREKRISAQLLLEQTIEQAERMEGVVNPIAVKLYERARVAAKAADELLRRNEGGPLCGLPITIKDSQWLAGVPCANGARSQQHFIPTQTCTAVQKLEEAGAVIFAKTTCPEFSLSGTTSSELYGTTTNPWALDKTCGGSSGGCGAAIASGIGSLSLGGDGGGSIRIPAAFCGIVGFKPSFGAIPRDPCFPSWKSLVSYGPMCRSVLDARLMYSTMVTNTEYYAFSDLLAANHPQPLAGKRIIVSEDLGFTPVDDDVRTAFKNIVEKLQQAGAIIIYDNPQLPSSVVAWATIAHFDSWSFQSQKKDPHEGLSRHTKGMMYFGASLTQENFNDAEQYREEIGNAYAAMYQRNDSHCFITPTLGLEAFSAEKTYPDAVGGVKVENPWLDWASFLYDANLIGTPACALPIGLGDDGLPLSIQITGPIATDPLILDTAEQIEMLTDWDKRPILNLHLPIMDAQQAI
jgi:Asp-tRNA(Asn)/Glu-tRNA(Gln) amidotransferase A subunit family amidase